MKTHCQAYRTGDTMICNMCRKQWDVNDPEPPFCPATGGTAPSSYSGGSPVVVGNTGAPPVAALNRDRRKAVPNSTPHQRRTGETAAAPAATTPGVGRRFLDRALEALRLKSKEVEHLPANPMDHGRAHVEPTRPWSHTDPDDHGTLHDFGGKFTPTVVEHPDRALPPKPPRAALPDSPDLGGEPFSLMAPRDKPWVERFGPGEPVTLTAAQWDELLQQRRNAPRPPKTPDAHLRYPAEPLPLWPFTTSDRMVPENTRKPTGPRALSRSTDDVGFSNALLQNQLLQQSILANHQADTDPPSRSNDSTPSSPADSCGGGDGACGGE